MFSARGAKSPHTLWPSKKSPPYPVPFFTEESNQQLRSRGFPGGAVVKNLPANAGDARHVGLIPGSGRSSGVGNGNPLQYSCLEDSVDREARWDIVHGVTRVQHD